MKLENVLLDHNGHCRISDLGLAVVSKVKIKGYAGTPGYTAPEMIKNKPYGPSADIFSFGVMLYRMLCGSVICHLSVVNVISMQWFMIDIIDMAG